MEENEMIKERTVMPVEQWLSIWETALAAVTAVSSSYIKDVVMPTREYLLDLSSNEKKSNVVSGAEQFIKSNLDAMVTMRKGIESLVEEYKIKGMVNELINKGD